MCELLGKNRLADEVSVSRAAVDGWLAGKSAPPPHVFKLMRRLLEEGEEKESPGKGGMSGDPGL